MFPCGMCNTPLHNTTSMSMSCDFNTELCSSIKDKLPNMNNRNQDSESFKNILYRSYVKHTTKLQIRFKTYLWILEGQLERMNIPT